MRLKNRRKVPEEVRLTSYQGKEDENDNTKNNQTKPPRVIMFRISHGLLQMAGAAKGAAAVVNDKRCAAVWIDTMTGGTGDFPLMQDQFERQTGDRPQPLIRLGEVGIGNTDNMSLRLCPPLS